MHSRAIHRASRLPGSRSRPLAASAINFCTAALRRGLRQGLHDRMLLLPNLVGTQVGKTDDRDGNQP